MFVMDTKSAEFTTSSEKKICTFHARLQNLRFKYSQTTSDSSYIMQDVMALFRPPWALLNIFALATFISSDKGRSLEERSNRKKNLISQPDCCILRLLLLIVRVLT